MIIKGVIETKQSNYLRDLITEFSKINKTFINAKITPSSLDQGYSLVQLTFVDQTHQYEILEYLKDYGFGDFNIYQV